MDVSRFRRCCRRLVTGLQWTAVACATLLLVTVVGSRALGWRTYGIASDSMAPALTIGDAVVVASISPVDAAVGDIITFPDPGPSDRLLTHRIVRISADGAQVHLQTQGDNAGESETWSIATDGSLGRVTQRLPRLGTVLVAAESPENRALLLGGPLALVAVSMLQTRPRLRQDPAPLPVAAAPPPGRDSRPGPTAQSGPGSRPGHGSLPDRGGPAGTVQTTASTATATNSSAR
jgi:signal peptidase I